MRGYIGYAFMLIAVITMATWLISRFILPLLPSEINNELLIFIAIFLGVLGLFSQIKDVTEFFMSAFEIKKVRTIRVHLDSSDNVVTDISPENNWDRFWQGAGNRASLPSDFYQWFERDRIGNEYIYYVAKRHSWLLFRQILPLFLFGLGISILGTYLFGRYNNLIFLMGVTLCNLLLIFWTSNLIQEFHRYFLIVTNYRVSTVKKADNGVYFLDQMVFMRYLLSIGMETEVFDRILNKGKIIIKHKNKKPSLEMKDVNKPEAVIFIIYELWTRMKINELEKNEEGDNQEK